MTKLTANTDLDALLDRLGVGPDEELRSSSRRKQHLETYARIMSGDWSVSLDLSGETAYIELKDEVNRIRIPTVALPQPETDLGRDVYDLIGQETLTLHEVGHYRYSDWPSFADHMSDLRDEIDNRRPSGSSSRSSAYRSAFKTVWNAIEDGCVEEFLKIEFRCADEFNVVNENLSSANSFGKQHERKGSSRTVYTMLQAVLLALMDMGHHESGDLARVLDPDDNEHTITTHADDERFRDFLPRIEQVLDDTHSEANAVERNRLVYEFFLDLMDLLDEADTSGLRDVGKQGDNSPMDGKPDDAHEGIGEADADMDIDGDGSQESTSGSVTAPSGQTAGGSGDDSDGSTEPSDGPLDDDIAEEFEDALRDEVRGMEGGESLMEELEEFQEILKGAGPGDTNDELIIPDPGDPDVDRWNEAQSEGLRLKNILEDALRESRHDQWRRNVQAGRFDRTRMIPAARGDPRACKRPRRGDEKDYSCVLVVDRSGSMSADIENVEFATGALAYALEELGVDVMVLDFVGGKTRLAKPFGKKTESSVDTLFTGDVGGGTPLSDATYLSRMRVRNGVGKHPFAIVITDGNAHNMSGYREEVSNCNFPVIGVYLRSDINRSDSSALSDLESNMVPFHRYRIITDDDSLPLALRQLANEVII